MQRAGADSIGASFESVRQGEDRCAQQSYTVEACRSKGGIAGSKIAGGRGNLEGQEDVKVKAQQCTDDW